MRKGLSMEQIKQAIERVKASATDERLHPMAAPQAPMAPPQAPMVAPQSPTQEPITSQAGAPRFKEVKLDGRQLEQHRIVAHSAADPRSKSFDMLRTQVLQAMDQKNWQFLAITSPTADCGKTVTAINLALSIARQPERSALLVDLDLQRPTVANYLGIKCQQGLCGILEGRTTLADAMIRTHVNSCELMVLPTEASTVHSSELISSRAMNTMLQDIRRVFKSRTVIFDMPPILQGDEVLALLPRIDCVLLVTAAGISTQHQIIECNKHLQSAEVVRLVLNKAHEPAGGGYYH
jgi:Mrp family chromosome partitioning ATPase